MFGLQPVTGTTFQLAASASYFVPVPVPASASVRTCICTRTSYSTCICKYTVCTWLEEFSSESWAVCNRKRSKDITTQSKDGEASHLAVDLIHISGQVTLLQQRIRPIMGVLRLWKPQPKIDQSSDVCGQNDSFGIPFPITAHPGIFFTRLR